MSMETAVDVIEVCGHSSKNTPFYFDDYVKVIATDPAHKNDKDLEFCWEGSYGQVSGDFYKTTRFVQVRFVVITIDDIKIIDVGLLCDNLKIIQEE